jgi:hypothetical protein
MRTFTCVFSLFPLNTTHSLTNAHKVRIFSHRRSSCQVLFSRSKILAVVSVQTRHTPTGQSPAAIPNDSRGVHSIEDSPRQPTTAHHRLLLSHGCIAVRVSTSRCRGRGSTVSGQAMNTHHPSRAPRTRRTSVQGRSRAGRPLRHAPKPHFCWRDRRRPPTVTVGNSEAGRVDVFVRFRAQVQ